MGDDISWGIEETLETTVGNFGDLCSRGDGGPILFVRSC